MIANSRDDPLYYLKNFQAVLSWVNERYRDLVTAEEREFIETFPSLPEPARALLVRMIMRKGTLFRASKLNYAEIGDSREAVEPLLAAGWVEADAELTFGELCGLLTKAEIVAAFRHLHSDAGLRKPELVERLQAEAGEPRGFTQWCPHSDDQVYTLRLMAICDSLRLMFFGNLRQDWSEFVLADLGVYRYEQVAFSLESRAFRCRDDIEAYLHLHACRERFESDEPIADILAVLPGAYDNRWLESRRAKLLFRLGQACERQGELVQAQGIYADCTHPGARVRQLRVLERLEQFEEALALAREAELVPESAAEAQHLERLMPRLRRKLGLPRPTRRPPADIERIDLILDRGTCRAPVELAVRDALHDASAPVHYVENTLITALFGLLCWEAIFAPLPGAFFHPFHSGPVDLLRPDFTTRRLALFDACLGKLDGAEYRDTILANYQAKRGIVSPFVHWEALDDTLIERALACFPPRHLRLWFERLLEDIAANRAGMPDLIQFWPEENRYRMIEVKGPGDRLQDNQKRWLDFCARHAMPVAVCYVQWRDHG
ncbi:VRR-NUC domain-containing protein [Modicisalibacter xianhensis]|uniref:phosphodiesterase I n=1 Tax=Modicisalibacter xianhensis TaxID=442341 RepID=A0A4R8FWZ2_9GAMM|nr:VRR-NUC domain-containing protein [Halomonas xianhensis]TDX31457.1 VRR-NUC domain-containing protein [Halomonas xianhensis]